MDRHTRNCFKHRFNRINRLDRFYWLDRNTRNSVKYWINRYHRCHR
jgi:hypothetical protein